MHIAPDSLNYVRENNHVLSPRFNYLLHFCRYGCVCVCWFLAFLFIWFWGGVKTRALFSPPPTTLIIKQKSSLNGRKQSFPWSPWVLYLELFQITRAATAVSHGQWTAGWRPQREVRAFSYHLHTRPPMCEHTHLSSSILRAITISLRPGKEGKIIQN